MACVEKEREAQGKRGAVQAKAKTASEAHQSAVKPLYTVLEKKEQKEGQWWPNRDVRHTLLTA